VGIREGGDLGSEASKNALRDLIERVTVFPPNDESQIVFEIQGRLASLLDAPEAPIFPNMKVRGGW